MPRNKLIANAFFHAGFVEAWGRGFEIIEESFKNAELEVPQFVEEFSGVTVNIKRDLKVLQDFGYIEHCGPARGGSDEMRSITTQHRK